MVDEKSKGEIAFTRFKDWSSVLGTWVAIIGAGVAIMMANHNFNKDIEQRSKERLETTKTEAVRIAADNREKEKQRLEMQAVARQQKYQFDTLKVQLNAVNLAQRRDTAERERDRWERQRAASQDFDLRQREELERRESSKKLADEHVQASFAMMARFQEPDFVDMRHRLVLALDQKYNCTSFSSPESPIKLQEIFTIVDFFDQAQYCVQSGLCDSEVFAQLLTPYANYWSPGLDGFLDGTHQSEKTFHTRRPYGAGLRAFATHPVKDNCR